MGGGVIAYFPIPACPAPTRTQTHTHTDTHFLHVWLPLHIAQDQSECLEDMREFDVPYHVRFAIDTDVRCGHWFTVKCRVRMCA